MDGERVPSRRCWAHRVLTKSTWHVRDRLATAKLVCRRFIVHRVHGQTAWSIHAVAHRL